MQGLNIRLVEINNNIDLIAKKYNEDLAIKTLSKIIKLNEDISFEPEISRNILIKMCKIISINSCL